MCFWAKKPSFSCFQGAGTIRSGFEAQQQRHSGEPQTSQSGFQPSKGIPGDQPLASSCGAGHTGGGGGGVGWAGQPLLPNPTDLKLPFAAFFTARWNNFPNGSPGHSCLGHCCRRIVFKGILIRGHNVWGPQCYGGTMFWQH